MAEVSGVDPRSPGASFLAFLAAPGLVAWSCWAYAFLAPADACCRGHAVGGAVSLGFLAFGAAIPAFYCRAPRPCRWGVAAIDLAAFLAGLFMLLALGSLCLFL